MGVLEQLADQVGVLTREVRDLRKDLLDLKQTKEEEAENPNQFITKKQAADLLKCSESTIDNYRRQGRLNSHKIGRIVRFYRDDVLAIVE